MRVRYAHAGIKEIIDGLDTRSAARINRVVDLLEFFGHNLRLPHSRALGNNLFELRIKGLLQIRILYCFLRGEAVILHIFYKKTATIPRKEIEYAEQIKRQLK
jgi:phage-related protein